MQGSAAPYFWRMLGWKSLTWTVRVMLVLFALHGAARPLQHAIHHDQAHHEAGLTGPQWHAQCVDCELDKLPVAPLFLQHLSKEKGFPVDLQRSLADRLMGDEVRGAMGRAPPACLS